MSRSSVWLLVAAGVAGSWCFTACSGDDATEGAAEAPNTAGRADAASGQPGDPPPPATVATPASLKVAFIGDTSAGDNFKSVLALIKREKADFVMIQGDLTYAPRDIDNWFPAIDNALNKAHAGSTADVTIPYFVSRGNHDAKWDVLGAGLKTRMAEWGIAPSSNDPTTMNYAIVHKGLKIVMVHEKETNPSRAAYLEEQLKADDHIWKICSWHKNQRASNVGPKPDQMGWEVYEVCRKYGAIVAQGHSHTYSRSKTLVLDANLPKVDAACNDPFELCLGPGKHFFFDSSLGGVDTRDLDQAVAKRDYWGASYTGSYGALFIEFNVDGDTRKARGYFKTIGNEIVDPPAGSGKSFFTITRAP